MAASRVEESALGGTIDRLRSLLTGPELEAKSEPFDLFEARLEHHRDELDAMVRRRVCEVADLNEGTVAALAARLEEERAEREQRLDVLQQKQHAQLSDWLGREVAALTSRLQGQLEEQLGVRDEAIQGLREQAARIAELAAQELQTMTNKLLAEREHRLVQQAQLAETLRQETRDRLTETAQPWGEEHLQLRETVSDQGRALAELRELSQVFQAGLAELREQSVQRAALEAMAGELRAVREETRETLAETNARLERELVQMRGAATDRDLLGGMLSEMSARWRPPQV